MNLNYILFAWSDGLEHVELYTLGFCNINDGSNLIFYVKGGFSLGFDRLLMLMTGMQNIKDVIPSML